MSHIFFLGVAKSTNSISMAQAQWDADSILANSFTCDLNCLVNNYQ